jgi:hypothetical protein
MFSTQDRRSETLRNSSVTPGDAGARDLEEANQILRDLKPVPREREIISAQAVARDSRKGINEMAELVEETIRSSAQGAGLSTSELSKQISLAKVYVVAEGSRNDSTLNKKSINGASPSELKLAAAEANGTRIGDVMPNPIAIENAEKMSNASPTAHAIAHGTALSSTIAEGLAFPMLQSIKESHDRIIGAHGYREQTGTKNSTAQSINATHQRLMAISDRLEAQQLAA